MTPPGISSAFLTALENVLVQPSGGSESGQYYAAGNGYANACVISTWVTSLSRTSTPVSVTVDNALGNFGTSGAAITTRLQAGGFQAYAYTNAAVVSAGAGGNYTINW